MKGSKGKHTICIHEGEIFDEQFGGAISPIYLSSSYPFIDQEEKRYPRYFNTPNQEVIAKKIAALEHAEAALPFASGMAAISTTLLSFLKKGDHAVFQNEIYGGSFNLVVREFEDYGISYTFTEGIGIDDFEKAIRPNTKVIYIETPSNPLLSITDIQAVADLARSKGIVSVIDNTFASPLNQTPLDFGIDISLHSATKYLGGHSDLCAGVVAGSRDHLERILHKGRNFGGSLSDFMCFMLERSIKTLGVRIEKHNENAGYLAEKLTELQGVRKVYYPGLKEHPGHDLARRQMHGFGGMLSFELEASVDVKSFQQNLKLIKPTMSLAGVETTVIQPSLTSHSLMTSEERERQGISDQLLRLSVGIENKEDILADLIQAFEIK
jgi:cystathionine beta-lyase